MFCDWLQHVRLERVFTLLNFSIFQDFVSLNYLYVFDNSDLIIPLDEEKSAGFKAGKSDHWFENSIFKHTTNMLRTSSLFLEV